MKRKLKTDEQNLKKYGDTSEKKQPEKQTCRFEEEARIEEEGCPEEGTY